MKQTFLSRRAALGLAVSIFALVPTCASAQTSPTGPDQSGATADQSAQTNEDPSAKSDQDIVITGSRIRRPDYETASPIISIGSQQLQQSGTTNITDYLTGLPALVGSSTSRDNSGDRAGIGATGLNLANLRNLGTERTLVLVDGRRHVAGLEGSQAVDLNTIPEDLIDRIDILTGGASAIYGADGVTGVVNFVLKKNFQGITARAQAGISRYGDAGQRLLAVTAGQNFAGGRGNIALAYEYGENDRLETKDRPQLVGTSRVGFYPNPDYDPDNPRAGVYQYIPLNDVRYAGTSRQSAVFLDEDSAFNNTPQFRGDGKPYVSGTAIPGGYTQGGDDTLVSDYGNDLLPRVRRHVVNLIGHYDASNALQFFVEGKYANTKSYSLGQPSFDYYLFVPEDNPYIPASIRSAIDPNVGGVFVNRDDFDLGQRGESITRETFRSVVGVKGDVSSSLHYEVSYVFGQTNVTNHFVNDVYNDRFYAALDAVRDSSGNITCRANIDPNWAPNQPDAYTRNVTGPVTFSSGQCSPINLFGENVSSQAGLDFIHANTTEHSRIIQHVVSGSLSGDTRNFLNLPGGPVGFAVGAEYRREASTFDPDPLEQQGLTFSNLLLPSHGSFDVKEVFGEIDIPLLKDRPFFQTLDFSGAVRYSSYSTIGSTTTWKGDATWAPIRDLRFRGTISRAVRAPNIGELFGATSQDFAFFDDPCKASNVGHGSSTRAANCQAVLTAAGLTPDQIANFDDPRSTNISGTSGGNPNLKPETANTWTAGLVLEPRWVKGLQVSFDWYNINLKQAINTVDPQQLAQLCVDQVTIDNQFCTNIHREQGTGLIDDFAVFPQNVANFRTAGLDVNLNYRFSVKKVGDFFIKVVGNYLDKLSFVGTPGAEPTDELGTTDSTLGSSMPKYQAYGTITYSSGPFSFNYSLSWWDKTRRYTQETTGGDPSYVDPEYAWYKERWVHSIYASMDVNKKFTLYGGVTNLFNQKADIGTILFPNDYTGTSFFAGINAKF